jgi:hypothetical protein
MKKTINQSQFIDEFHMVGRGKQFSFDALELLYDFLEEYNPDMELDVVAICCEFEESTIEEIAENYSIPIAGLTSRGKKEAIFEFLDNHTIVVGETDKGTIVYQQF